MHDEALADEPELLRAVAAAAALTLTLTLDNERLNAELRARLEELTASRARIVEATAAERRRIERNLHDGAQQRLTSVTMALGLAEARLRVGGLGEAAPPASSSDSTIASAASGNVR